MQSLTQTELEKATNGKYWIIKTDSTTYEYHFIPLSCDCGGVSETGYGYLSADEAIKAALDRALVVNTQGFHTHYAKVVKDKKRKARR
jgi:hypothetical protein